MPASQSAALQGCGARLAVAAVLAAALLAVGAAAAKGSGKTSELWGKAGEKWTPDGLLMDFSYAGAFSCRQQQAHPCRRRRPCKATCRSPPARERGGRSLVLSRAATE